MFRLPSLAARRTTHALVAVLLVTGAFGLSGCDLDLTNPNAADTSEVFGTRDGLIGAGTGLQRLYNVSALDDVVKTPGVTARELATARTFANLIDLEEGGTALLATNNSIANLSSALYRVLGYAEDLIEGARTVETVEDDLESGLVALGQFYQGVAIGTLAQSFTHVALETDRGGNATYVTRQEALEAAADLLAQAEQTFLDTPPGEIITSDVLADGFDFLNTARAYRARYELFAGRYEAALDAVDDIDGGATSVFPYTDTAPNPIYEEFFVGNPSYAPRDDFGLEEPFEGDQRLDFYLDPSNAVSVNTDLPIEVLSGFFAVNESTALPAYLPGELDLIRAEAYVRLNQFDDAVDAIDAVRTKTPAEDPFGVGAGLDAYSGPVTEEALIEEIFRQRASELYLQGLRLEDARRLGRPAPTTGNPFVRTRNFYPFPQQERLANPNTPADPPI